MTTQKQQEVGIGKSADPIMDRTDEQIAAALKGKPAKAVNLLLTLRDYARQHKLGLKGLSSQTGMPQGVLSQLFSGSYPGDYEARAALIAKFLEDLEKTRVYGGCRNFVETRIARSLWQVFEKTRYNRRIQIIQSEEQLGKTRAAREYAARHNSGHTVMITLQPPGASNGFGLFLRSLARAMDISTDHRKLMEVRFAIQARLSTCDLVIIDEFHLVATWADRAVEALLDFIRISLHADGERGVVLIATNSQVMNLLQEFRRRARYNLGQLLGRMCNQVLELYPDEIPTADVKLLVGRYYPAKRDTLMKLYDITTRKKLGHFGLLDDILSRAWAEAQVAGKKVTDRLVLKVAEETMEDIGKRQELYA